MFSWRVAIGPSRKFPDSIANCAALSFADAGEVEIDANAIDRLDSAGAWLLLRTKYALEEAGKQVTRFTLPEHYHPLLESMERDHVAMPVEMVPARYSLTDLLERMGRGTEHVLRQGYDLLGFLGRTTVETTEAVVAPRRELPLPALIHQIQETGLTALPIVGLLSFLLGVVMAYQGADQLRRFGAEIYTINLLGVSILREVGGLITAIVVAGRSGSAFTAQIGTMQVNEEIDAMQALGLNIAEELVVPRVLGLVITLPLLTFYADVMGMIGGAVMSYFDLGYHLPRIPASAARGDFVADAAGGPDQGSGLRFRDRTGGLFRGSARGAQCRQRRQAHNAFGRRVNLSGDRVRCRLFHTLFHSGVLGDEFHRTARRSDHPRPRVGERAGRTAYP